MKKSRIQPPADWHAAFDGSCSPNPGKCRIAGILRHAASGKTVEWSRHAGEGDSSDAEYQALIALLQTLALHCQPGQSARIQGDSQVVIQDVLGTAPRPAAILSHYRTEAQAILARFPDWHLHWVPRHRNQEADQLLRQSA